MKDDTPDTREQAADRPADKPDEPEARTPDGGEPGDKTSGVPEGAEGHGAPGKPPEKAPETAPDKAKANDMSKPATRRKSSAGGKSARSDAGAAAKPEPPSTPTPPPDTPAKPAPGGRSASVVAMLSLALAVVALLVALWSWTGGQDIERRMDSVSADARGDISRLESAVSALREDRQRVDQTESQDDQAISDLDGRVRRLADRVTQAESSLAAKGESATATRRTYVRAELEYLLQIAVRELTLSGDPGVALEALRTAEARLEELDDPRLQDVWEQVSSDVLALESVELPDVDGMALRLGSLEARAGSLPVRMALLPTGAAPEAAPEDESGWARMKRRTGEFFDQFFKPRRIDGPPTPLLGANDTFFLRKNLELNLATARLALLAGEESAYRESLRAARRQLETYFDLGQPSVSAFLEGLNDLESRSIRADLPDVSGGLRMLRDMRADAA